MLVEWRMHQRRNIEHLKSRVGELILDLVIIHSEWKSIAEILTQADARRKKRTPEAELWQMLYLIPLPPSLVQIDVSNKLGPLLTLKSRAVIERSGAILSQHLAMISNIQNYNSLMERYEHHMEQHTKIKDGQRFFEHVDGDVKEDNLRVNLVHHINLISEKVPTFLKEIEACQVSIYKSAETHFGSAEFLKLP